MFQAVGYDVTYRREAFRYKSWDGRSYVNASSLHLKDAFEWAAKCVLAKSNGQWIIHPKSVDFYHEEDAGMELAIVVPAGSDRREQLTAVVNHFEEAMTERLDGLVDITFRSIEDDDPPASYTPSRIVHNPKRDDLGYFGFNPDSCSQ